ncbi:MAG: VOC family protein [Myxococcota bacterium]|nr:VOC family protein [Myxococcota bacterium]
MLSRIDRVQMAVPDRHAAAEGWQALLGAEPAGEDRVDALAAQRMRLRLGDGFVELLEPDGAGPVADAVAGRGGHLFAAGATSPDVDALAARLRERGAEPRAEGGQLHLDPGATGVPGLRVVVSPEESRPSVGAIDTFYEVTGLVGDAKAAVGRCAERFGLDPDAFVPIASKPYGYEGSLTLFDPDRLDRFELITPHVPENTMGRFFRRFGETLYMAFAESGELGAGEERARARGVGFTAEPRAERRAGRPADTIFLHPPALGGMMLGLSRRTWAWRWSGHPERVEEPA